MDGDVRFKPLSYYRQIEDGAVSPDFSSILAAELVSGG